MRYVDQNTRIEQQTGFMDPITPADVEFALHADAFVCVPITDYETGQATLAYIKEHSAGTILLDAHGPTSTLVSGERRRRLWVERDSWLPHIDLPKMNLEEAGCSWFPSRVALEHHDAGAPIATETLPEFAEHCLRHGVTAVCITLDERGCAAYWLDENGDLAERIVPRIPIEHVVDTTGAGDSFAAGWRSATCRTPTSCGPRSTATRWARSAAPARRSTSTSRCRRPTSSSPTSTAPPSRADVALSCPHYDIEARSP